MTDPRPERWLVTGATGQLGGHTLCALSRLAARADVLALSRRSIPFDAPLKAVQNPTAEWLGSNAASPQRSNSVGSPGSNPATRIAIDSAIVDLGDLAKLRSTIETFRPTHVIHLGALTSVAEAFNNPDQTERVNVAATRAMADITADLGARMVFASTDMVFDGESAPYAENAETKPLSTYGRSKAIAESVLAGRPHVAIARFPLMFGIPKINRDSTVVQQIQALRVGTRLNLFTDEFRTPLWLGDAATAAIRVARMDISGILHFPGPERLSRLQMVERFAQALGIESARLNPISRLDIESPEPRPKDLSLSNAHTSSIMPDFDPRPICGETLQ